MSELTGVLEQARGLLERCDDLTLPTAIVGATCTMEHRHAAIALVRSTLGLEDRPGLLTKWTKGKPKSAQLAALDVAIANSRGA